MLLSVARGPIAGSQMLTVLHVHYVQVIVLVGPQAEFAFSSKPSTE